MEEASEGLDRGVVTVSGELNCDEERADLGDLRSGEKGRISVSMVKDGGTISDLKALLPGNASVCVHGRPGLLGARLAESSDIAIVGLATLALGYY